MKKAVTTEKAPGAIGPYSQAVEAGGFIFVSGQLPINPATGDFAGSDIGTQTRQSLANVEAILREAGFSMQDVVKATVFLDDMADFGEMNSVYNSFFDEPYPARAAVAVETLPKNALVEIEVIAHRGRPNQNEQQNTPGLE